MQNAPLGSFCITFDLHSAIIGLENQFMVFLRAAVLHRFTRHLQMYLPFCEKLYYTFKIRLFQSTDSGGGTYTVTLASGKTLNYETVSSYEIKASAFDGGLTTTAVITVQINDVGEAPTLNPDTPVQTFTIDESTVR